MEMKGRWGLALCHEHFRPVSDYKDSVLTKSGYSMSSLFVRTDRISLR